MLQLDQIQKVYFLGIGGIGMSALARYFRFLNKEVAGYDKVQTELTEKLVSEGMKIHYEDDISQIPDNVDLVVWTPAIPNSLKEKQYLEKSVIPMMKRSEVLGIISHSSRVIAVAGTHGKTTTSIMLSYLLKEGGFDISAFLGGISKDYHSNFLAGKSDLVVMEADEYDRSFWRLTPESTIVTSMDPDHLDVYGDYEEMIRSYKVFISQTRDNGYLIYHYSLKDVLGVEFIKGLTDRGITCTSYGLGEGDVQAMITGPDSGYVQFDLESEGNQMTDLKMKMAGSHNVLNMTAAVTMALQIGIKPDQCKAVLPEFSGIDRRFEIHDLGKDRYLVDDYAHHPRELEAVIQASREFFKGKRVTAVFQPHLFSRTKDFGVEFAKALDAVDRPILVELYPAREEPVEGIDSGFILNFMRHPDKMLTTKKKLIDLLKEEKIEILLILGAGDLNILIPEIINELTNSDE